MNFNYVIVDTAGRTVIDEAMMREVAEIRQRLNPPEVLLVADAMTGQDAVKVAEQFHAAGRHHRRRADQDGRRRARRRGALAARGDRRADQVRRHRARSRTASSSSTRIASPPASSGMGDVMTLIEKAQQQTSRGGRAAPGREVQEGHLRPGGLPGPAPEGAADGAARAAARDDPRHVPGDEGPEPPASRRSSSSAIEAIIQSMTPYERRNPDIIGTSRKRRIAQGSGTTTADVNKLLNQFREMQKMMKMFSRGKMPKGPGRR